jgi:hypothetical protein
MPAWKGEAATDHSKRDRARRALRLVGVPCARCGQPATERHHRTGNLDDHSLDEIEPLCTACHVAADRQHSAVRALRFQAQREHMTELTAPHAPQDEGQKRKTYRLDADVEAGIKAIVAKNTVSENAVVNTLLRAALTTLAQERERRRQRQRKAGSTT